MTKDIENAEVVSAFFASVFTGKVCSHSLVPARSLGVVAESEGVKCYPR